MRVLCELQLAIGVVWLAAGCGGAASEPDLPPLVPEPFTDAEVAELLRLSPLPPPPPDPTNRLADDPGAARFGQRLFFDPRLSKTGATSCATCHDPEQAWGDGQPLAEGILPLVRHSPTLWNVAHQRWFFWDGRTDSLWAQALVPLESPLEHASSRLQIAHLIHDDPQLRAEYEALFGAMPELDDEERFPARGRPVPEDDHAHKLAAEHERRAAESGQGHTHGPGSHFYHPHQRAWDSMTEADREAVTGIFVNVGKSIAAFERRIVAGDSPFDRFVAGIRERDLAKIAALDESARRGAKLFLAEAACVTCHDGPTFSDKEFHDIGIPPGDGGEADDPGRQRGIDLVRNDPFNGVGPWADDPESLMRYKIDLLPTHVHAGQEFKTPSLRNVAVTAPYMHHGQLATLEEVVRFYSTLEDARPRREKILRPLNLTDDEQRDLIAFLEALTDVGLDPKLLRPPDPWSRHR